MVSLPKHFSFISAGVLLLCVCALGLMSACAPVEKTDAPDEARFKKASFSDLSGWKGDNLQEALQAFQISCARIMQANPEKAFGPDGVGGTYADWQAPCQTLQNNVYRDPRVFFETWFRPWKVSSRNTGDDEGLFTGYFEPELYGATYRSGRYRYPLLKMPKDLVMVDLGAFREDLKGRRIAGRVINNRLRPYETRGQIVNGSLSMENAEPLVWVDDPIDAFFLHIQGSGRVALDDGGSMRVGYDGQNGHPYYAIGRELIKRGELSKETVSLQSIRAWLEAHPDQAHEIMNTNKSYIFFRELEESGPLGAEGVVLTPGRSLAVDRVNMPYGAPVWVNIDEPLQNYGKIRRLMVAQDTGGAIRGAVRGDVFWGHGETAETLAGHMKSQGKMWLLLPRDVTP